MIAIQQPERHDLLYINKLLEINAARGHFLPGRTDSILTACFTNEYHKAPATIRVAINKTDKWAPPDFAGFYLLTRADKTAHEEGLQNVQEIFAVAVQDDFQKKGVGRILLENAVSKFQETRWAKYLIARTHAGISTRMEHLLAQSSFTIFIQEEKVNFWAISK